MNKILVIGCSGAGKSRFSRLLSEKTGIPVLHLDLLFWNADRTHITREAFRARVLEEMAKFDRLIVDGDYHATLDSRLPECDTVFLFDLPPEECLRGVKERRGKPRPDMAWVETEEDPEFYRWVLAFREERLPHILSLLAEYPDKKIVRFSSREDADRYLAEL